MEKTARLIEFKTVWWRNFEFQDQESVMPLLDNGWQVMSEPFPVIVISIPVHERGAQVPQFLYQVETWCGVFYRWKDRTGL